MLLFREVYGWLRYLLAKDPLCNSQGIVIEEISSTMTPFSDVTDGLRTLIIHKVQDGMTPRIEIRAVGTHPQIFWYGSGDSSGVLLAVSNQYGFPGDYKSWDCSDLCQWVLKTTKDKLCGPQPEHSLASVAPVTAKKTLDFPIVRRILDAVIRASKKGTRLTRDMVNKWLKENEKADLWDFALSVIHWFDKGKLDWKDIDYLEDEKAPGKDIIDWTWLKRQLNEPSRLGKLPAPVADRIQGNALMPAEAVQARFTEILTRYTQGHKAAPLLGTDVVRFGRSAIASLKAGKVSFQYLQQLERCDPNEVILPWSFIRRNVLSYSNMAVDEAEKSDKLAELILTWLHESHLLLLLYKGDPEQEVAISKALQVQLDYHIKQTLSNRTWLTALLHGLAEVKDGKVEVSRALQVDFDLWLLDALSPAVSKWKIPLSPHAFSIEQKDQKAYDKMFKVWVKCLKEHLKEYQIEVKDTLKEAFEKFFNDVVSSWKFDALKDYKAKIPSASKILNAVERDNKEGLLQVLVDDFENEVGSSMPSEIKEKLLACPYFNTIMREVKLQGLRLD
jgi:hypothetical protein